MQTAKKFSPVSRTTSKKVAWSASMGFAAYWAYLYFSQTRHIFKPVNHADQTPTPTLAPEFTEVRLAVAPGVELEGWIRLPLRPVQSAGKHSCAIYFGGRSEDVRWLLKEAQGFGDLPLVFFNYRGYGRSAGKPDEKRLVSDARAIYDWVRMQPWCDPQNIHVLGRSLGTGVAIQLAAQAKVRKLVLLTPYDSLLSIAKAKVPMAPVSLLLRSRFNSAAHAGRIQSSTCIVLADKDEVVPHESSLRLLSRFEVKPLVAKIPGTDHVNLPHTPAVQSWIAKFFGQEAQVEGSKT